jgi:hypothetical protein
MPEMSDIVFDLAPTAPHRLTDPETTFAPGADQFADYMHALGPELNEKLPLLIELAGLVKPSGQSVTSMTLSEGVKSDIAAGSGKTVVIGAPIRFASAADPAVDYMDGIVTAYNFVTGNMNALIDNLGPSAAGTHTDWHWSVTGPRGSGGDTFASMLGNAGKVWQVNAGESAGEWIGRDWELIGTLSPSGAANAIFSSIAATYAELFLHVESLTHPGTVSVTLQVSGDSSAYATGYTISGTTAGTYKGGIWIPRYTADSGILLAQLGIGSSPYVNIGNGGLAIWAATTGIEAIKLLMSSGNITATLKLYGKR